MKVFLRNVHLYLALAAGLVIMISCVTGAILVFEDEFDHQFHPERYEIIPKGERLPLQQLVKTAVNSVHKAKVSAVKVFTDPKRPVEVALIKPEKKEGKGGDIQEEKVPDGKDGEGKGKNRKVKAPGEAAAKGKKGKDGNKKDEKAPKPSVYVYMNPYTGQITGTYNKREAFFTQVENLHRFLLGGQNSIGKTIIGLSTLSFLIITITGIVLWWPKNKKILMQRLKFKTDGSFKRLNHDLHIVTGFYTSVFMTVIIMSGLVMVFTWVNKGIFTLTGTTQENPKPPVTVYQAGKKAVALDVLILNIDLKGKKAELYTIRMPKDSAGIFTVNVLPEDASIETASDTYYLDQYSGAVIGQLKYADKNIGQKIRSYVRPVHTGEVFGLPTKILNFILCILTFSFPITGVIMWLNRIKKSKNKKAKPTPKPRKREEVPA
ncbi:MAG TPA: PepSY-associated TM helix domain-containing protein [Pedobacter sp.]